MADSNLYDEFGNYIGPDLASEQEEEEADFDDEEAEARANSRMQAGDMSEDEGAVPMDADESEEAGPMENAVVLHEDKKYYPTA
mmetsp:Transcript_825/g.1238  ORF Transcript_825/g.1238 Transcript_825/m.1238 type:complete len:84 (+) Transcript_825:135-386(+)